MSGFQTPGIQSGMTSPFYGLSRSGSSENLSHMSHSDPVAPAALLSRLANVSNDPLRRDVARQAGFSSSGMMSPGATNAPGYFYSQSAPHTEPASVDMSRSNSGEDHSHQQSRRSSQEDAHVDTSEFAELNKVPSYSTAVRTPVRSVSWASSNPLPDYQTAISTSSTPPAHESSMHSLATISEVRTQDHRVAATH